MWTRDSTAFSSRVSGNNPTTSPWRPDRWDWSDSPDVDLINLLDNSIYVLCIQELLRLESAWHKSVCLAISHLGSKTFHVVYKNKPSAFTLGKSSPRGLTYYV